MPRIRTVKPEALQHRKLGKASDRAVRVWLALLTQADDEGRLVCDADHLRVVAFAYHPRVSAAHVEAALRELATLGGGGLVTLYTVKDTRYACLPSWADHQKISHPTPSSLPGCDAPGAALEPLDGDFHRRSHKPAPFAHSGELRNVPEDSGALQNALEHSASRARGSDRIGSEGSDRRERRTRTAPEDSGDGSAPATGASPGPPVFQIPETIRTALERAPRFRPVPALHRPAFWQAQLRACPTVDHASELLKAHAWIEANPRRAPKRDLPRFLHRWLMTAAEDADDAGE